MNNYFFVEFDKNVTSYNFYNNVLMQLSDYYSSRIYREAELILDFSQVEYINPLVVPNILTVGAILKNYYKYPVKLHIPWKPNLISYLSHINFFYISRREELFELSEEYIGDVEKTKIDPQCKTYSFSYGTSEVQIRTILKKSDKMFKLAAKQLAGNSLDEEPVKYKLIDLITEMIVNGCSHSESMCFFTIQLNKFANCIYIAISDLGIGYYNSFLKKDFKDAKGSFDFIDTEQKTKNGNLLSILEALIYRYKYKDYGLWQVATKVINYDGVLRIHTDDTQYVLTEKSFLDYLTYNIDTDKTTFNKEGLLNELLKKLNSFNYESNSFSSVRRTTNFKGVHIELEIPFKRGVKHDEIFL